MKKKFNFKLLLGVLLIIILIILIFIAYFKIKNKNTVLNNVYLGDLNISKMTYIELKNYLDAIQLDGKNIDIVSNGEILIQIGAKDIGYAIDSSKTVNNVMRRCSNSNVFVNFINTLKSYFEINTIDVEYVYSKESIDTVISKILSELPGRVVNDSYFVQDNTLILTKGDSGYSINKEKFTQDILSSITMNIFNMDVIECNIDLVIAKPKALEYEEVYNYIKKEVEDAKKIEVEGKTVYISHKYGVGVDKVKLQETIDGLSEENKTASINLDIIEPKVKLGDLKSNLYEDILGTYTTRFSLENQNRNANIKLAASFLDEVVIQPGEIFSFNKVVGNCDLESRGFKEATIYANGGLAKGIGGGVCQVSSTVYMAAMYANLEIVERYNHAYTVSYLDPCFDATIAYPYLDLKFKNNRTYPIKFIVSFDPAGKLSISIYGTKEEIEYDVTMESETITTTNFQTIYKEDDNLEAGQQVVSQNGQKAISSKCYKILSFNGEVVSKSLVSTDRYLALTKIILIGVDKNKDNNGGE